MSYRAHTPRRGMGYGGEDLIEYFVNELGTGGDPETGRDPEGSWVSDAGKAIEGILPDDSGGGGGAGTLDTISEYWDKIKAGYDATKSAIAGGSSAVEDAATKAGAVTGGGMTTPTTTATVKSQVVTPPGGGATNVSNIPKTVGGVPTWVYVAGAVVVIGGGVAIVVSRRKGRKGGR